MKKFLSLVLALVMTMSLVTISAGAKNFTDDSKITYKDAVAVMSDIGVIDGYTGGGFQPTTTLTRGAAAKIICNMILGPTTAGALSADAAPFKDVPANHTFAGYIAYCAQQGIINGYADGTFRPAGTLNGYAFMKMLLGALGYDSKLEGYTGANWSIAVAKQALAIGLADGNDEFSGANAVTREEAMQYAFNTLDTDMVQYKDKGSSIIVGGVEIVNPASSAEKVPQSGYKNNMGNKETLQFAEKYFKDLKKDAAGSDAFGRPAAEWSYKGDVSATVTVEADATYTKSVKYKDIYKDINVKSAKDEFKFFVDGVEAKADITIDKSGTKVAGSGNGVLVEVFYDTTEDEEVATIVVINTYYDEISDVDENDDDERIVKIGSMEFVTEEFEEDDKVIYTKDDDAEKEDKIQTMATPESITGTLTKMVGDGEFVVDGKTYKKNATGTVDGDVNVKDDVTMYLDAYGYVIYMEEADDNTSIENMAYVLDGGAQKSAGWAKLLFTDGKTKVVDLENKTGAGFIGTVVSFKDNDGTYKLSDRSDGFEVAAGKVEFKKGATKVTIGGKTVTTNAKTLFVYAIDNGADDDMTYKVYTGYKSAPSVKVDSAKAAAYVKSGTTATLVVFEVKAEAITTTSDLTFIAADKDAKPIDNGDDALYYEFQAVVDGKITTIMVNKTTGFTILDGAAKNTVMFVYKTVNYDSSDIMKDSSTPAVEGDGKDYILVTTADKESNEVIGLGGNKLPYTDDVKVFFVDDAEITEGEIGDIREDDGGDKDPYANIYYTVNTDGEVETIILVKK